MALRDEEARPVLDESSLQHVLAFVNEPRGRLCSKAWSEHLYEALQLEHRIRFHKLVRKAGSVTYHHSAVRAFGQDFEECVAYQFELLADKTYSLAWNRSFGQWSAANQRQCGRWTVVGDKLRCESIDGPQVPENCVRYAPGGLVFQLPIENVCRGSTVADGDDVCEWEYGVRGEPIPEIKALFCKPEEPSARESFVRQDANARYVEVNGELHEVSGDIRREYPEADWQRLMACRIRFGLGN